MKIYVCIKNFFILYTYASIYMHPFEYIWIYIYMYKKTLASNQNLFDTFESIYTYLFNTYECIYMYQKCSRRIKKVSGSPTSGKETCRIPTNQYSTENVSRVSKSHINASFQTWVRHITHKRVMSHMYASNQYSTENVSRVQGGEDSSDPPSCISFSTEELLDIRHFCWKWPERYGILWVFATLYLSYIWTGYFIHEWGMSHVNESCHICTRRMLMTGTAVMAVLARMILLR